MPNAFEGAAKSDPPPTRVAVGVLLLITVATLFIVFVVGSIVLRGVSPGRESQRRSQCMNHLKQFVAAAVAHEISHGRLPLASSQPFSGRPGGSGPSHPAGYSWLAPLLPFLGKDEMYDRWKKSSDDFQLGPFDTEKFGDIPQLQFSEMLCPSNHQPDLDIINSEYQRSTGRDGSKDIPKRSSYIAFAGSHFTNATGLGELYEADPQSPFDGNGAMPFPRTAEDVQHGIALDDLRVDGLSNTLLLCETLETAYAAWCDGQAMWAVGAWPGNAQVPSATGGPDGQLGWLASDTESRASIASGDDDDPALAYLPKSRYTAGHDRRWGPSSNHSGGVVMHAFADGSVRAISPDIDRNLYLRLISRDEDGPVMPYED